MNQRIRKAEYLLDEIGNIDEAIISSVSLGGKKRGYAYRRAITAVAAVAVIAMIALGAFVIGSLRGNEREDGKDLVREEPKSIEEVLEKARESEITEKYAKADDIDLFDGKTKIVFSESDSDGYYVIEVTERSGKDTLSKALYETFESSVDLSEENRIGTNLWISYGDGRVVSPYLDKSEGNVGYGEIFDYSAEIVPSESLVELIYDLISE